MAEYIFMENNGIHIIDLNKTLACLEEATFALKNIVRSGRKIMFVATKKQAKDIVTDEARRLNMPFRTGGSLCASKLPDAQAAYESAQTLLPTLHAGTNFVLHAAGWLEGGLSSSYEKLIMDMDQLGMMHVLAKGIDLSENGQAMDALREVGPGGHFLGCAHTQANFETAFYRSSVADNNSVEQWEAEGRKDAPQRANAIWKKMLAEYEPPPIDPGTDEALREFIQKRKDSMPDAWH